MAPGAPRAARPRVFSIAAGAPFLPVLADAVLDGKLVTFDRADPLALADVTVFLPTRRSVRSFRDVLAVRLGNAILPQVRALGDIDEDDLIFSTDDETTAERLVLPPAISFRARHLALTRLILAWRRQVRAALLMLREGDPVRIPASAADAARLARDLARLGHDMAIAGIPWAALAGLGGDDHARYFQITLDFLKIVAEQWPAYLADTGRLDPAARRDQIVRARAAALGAGDAAKPFIVAGSTGSMPATAALIKAVARLPNGAVVLPGLDRDLDEAGWAALGAPGDVNSADAHPQFALKALIAGLRLGREDIADLASAPAPARARLLSEAMRPASTAEQWTAFRADPSALDGATLILARNEQEEATAIAVAIREAVETPGRNVALVTPDRTLARRVAAELGRWGLAVDDSAGGRLDREPAGIFARLLAEAAAEPSPVALLALAKHPLAAFGMGRLACRRAARELELGVLRGRRLPRTVADLPDAVKAARAEAGDGTRHVPSSRRLFEDQWDQAAQLAAAMGATLGPLAAALSSGAEIAAADVATRVRAALTAAATDDTSNDTTLWAAAGGAQLDSLLAEIEDETEAGRLLLAPGEAPYFLAELMRDCMVPRPAIGTPNVHIWGALEARLQPVDLVILGGLDEGVWPSGTRTDPWLSRAMREEIGLPPPERRTGLAAHDFVQTMAGPQVVVTRAEKRDGAPTVESRWMQRIRALAGPDAMKAMEDRGKAYVSLARQIDAPESAMPDPVRRPQPKPPVAIRPSRLSITEIETLIRDPYAIYAKHVLSLRKLDPLGAPADARTRGNIIHEALGNFVTGWSGAFDAKAEADLIRAGQQAMQQVEDEPDVHAVWSLRFLAIARWLIAFEAARGDVEKRHVEIDGVMMLDTAAGPFTLRGRADRIDTLTGEGLAIYDFKTGTPQTERTVFAGLTPQMTLTSAMARRGAFTGIAAGRSVRDLAWLAVGKCGREDPHVSAVGKGHTADSLGDRAHGMLQGLVDRYAQEVHGYLSRARPLMERSRKPFAGDYDHLARVREWALVESEEDLAK